MNTTNQKRGFFMQLKLFLKNRFASSVWGWIESFIMTIFILVIGFYLFPSDPFFIHTPFPWTWLVPVLIALRYGTTPAIFSIALLIACFVMVINYSAAELVLYKIYFLGGSILTLICGEFNRLWSHQTEYHKQLSEYTSKQLENLSTTYCLTRLSHHRLEQSLITKPVTLRSSLSDLRLLLSRQHGEFTPESVNQFLKLASQYCSLDCAAIFKIENFIPTCLAQIGSTIDFDASDILIRYSLIENTPSYYAINQLKPDEKSQSQYLVSVPMRDYNGHIFGLLLVKNMPFYSFDKETLQILAILVNYFTYELWAARLAQEIINIYSDCPLEFASELFKLTRLKRDLGTDSAIVALYLKDTKIRNNIILQYRQLKRSLDYIWQTEAANQTILITLMPFANTTTVEGFYKRVQQWLKELFDVDLNYAQASLHYTLITEDEPVKIIKTIIEHTHG